MGIPLRWFRLYRTGDHVAVVGGKRLLVLDRLDDGALVVVQRKRGHSVETTVIPRKGTGEE